MGRNAGRDVWRYWQGCNQWVRTRSADRGAGRFPNPTVPLLLPSGSYCSPGAHPQHSPTRAVPETTALSPSTAKAAGGSPEMADVGCPKAAPPDGGLAAFQRSLCCIIYRKEITAKWGWGRTAPPLWGDRHHRHHGCQDPSHWGHGHLPGHGRTRGHPSGSHFALGCFGAAPRQGQRQCHPVPCFGGTG